MADDEKIESHVCTSLRTEEGQNSDDILAAPSLSYKECHVFQQEEIQVSSSQPKHMLASAYAYIVLLRFVSRKPKNTHSTVGSFVGGAPLVLYSLAKPHPRARASTRVWTLESSLIAICTRCKIFAVQSDCRTANLYIPKLTV